MAVHALKADWPCRVEELQEIMGSGALAVEGLSLVPGAVGDWEGAGVSLPASDLPVSLPQRRTPMISPPQIYFRSASVTSSKICRGAVV